LKWNLPAEERMESLRFEIATINVRGIQVLI